MKHMDDAAPVDNDALLQALVWTGHGIKDHLDTALAPLDLSLPKLHVLGLLAETVEPLFLGALSARVGCVKSNMTQLVDRLESERLVRRVPDIDDRRSIRLELTPEGRSRHSVGRRVLVDAEYALLAGLSGEERALLWTLLGRFGHYRKCPVPARPAKRRTT